MTHCIHITPKSKTFNKVEIDGKDKVLCDKCFETLKKFKGVKLLQKVRQDD